MNGGYEDDGVYHRKIEILELHGYPLIRWGGCDYVSDEGQLVAVDDIQDVYEFLGL